MITSKKREGLGSKVFITQLKKFTGGIMPTLSKLSKAFLLPIALLPIAGVFLGVGAAISNAAANQSFLWYVGTLFNKMGDVAFGNLPILFCISVALAYTKDSGIAAITGVVGFLVMNGAQSALIHPALDSNGAAILGSDGRPAFALLWYGVINSGLITNNVGIQSLNTGVFAGIFVGAIAAWSYNKFHKTQLPQAISFFSGTKLVPIIAFFSVLPLSFIIMFIWPLLGAGLAALGVASGNLPMGVSSFVFEIIERSLVPFGLHHVFYAPLWWTSAGADIQATVNAASLEKFAGVVFSNGRDLETLKSTINDYISGGKTIGLGDQTAMTWVLGNLNIINFTDLQKLGLNLGQYQAGKYGFMMFGLPAAGVAMWLNVPKENRKNVMGIYLSAGFTCFLTGITEPIEYTFLFLAPWMFYGIHMPLAAISFFFAGFMGTHITMTVSGGFIDYIVFGVIGFASGAMSVMSAFGILIVSVAMGPVYFFAFYFAVKKGNVMVPGRDGSADAQLATKADFKESKGLNLDGSKIAKADNNEEARMVKARKLIEFIGGEENIIDVDACASRLRLTVVNPDLVNKEGIMSLGGSTGTLVRGKNVQIVYGGEQEAIKPRMIQIIDEQRAAKKVV
ncbi:PTS transporter subunit EIIC [Mesoplasma corruscae]|uniref:PTS system, glucose-specific IIBC component n=1 Tax=Mesoplasma corruscae TaxID=216874 RepID=A0A2S5RGN7_9MOLU|nr:PTS transporter subunit EIIC [Mesoplasma corruscae]PPE06458.1 PTS system, glucose-specific IIBC component [Mesoplasma corruscae]